MKEITWELHYSEKNNVWWTLYVRMRSLEKAKQQKEIEENYNLGGYKFKIIRVEETREEFDEEA